MIPLLLILSGVVFSGTEGWLFGLSQYPSLGQYNVDKNAVSVSGISSGAAMAIQYHMALSSKVMGLGVIAGVPYGCAGLAGITVTICMNTPSLENVAALVTVANSASSLATIDNVDHLKNDKVFVYHSRLDSVVRFASGQKIVDFYKHFIPNSSNIATQFNIKSEHGVPTLNYGSKCGYKGGEYLMNCGYSVAFHILNHIYGGHLQAPTASTPQSGELLKFDQSSVFYLSSPSTYSMDDLGYVYIPSGCKSKTTKCKLHIAFHGCHQGVKEIGESFVRHAGYNEAGELNNIIILYPQVISTLTNPEGCWDWWGYTGIYYGTKDGFQITAVRRMMEKITG